MYEVGWRLGDITGLTSKTGSIGCCSSAMPTVKSDSCNNDEERIDVEHFVKEIM